jgi:hypothetical protein|tara:strand:- start:872 stop:1270 length:399 start_codon:yes stop_codon:yes gene_type:complete
VWLLGTVGRISAQERMHKMPAKRKKKVLLKMSNGRVITEAKDGIHISSELDALEKKASPTIDEIVTACRTEVSVETIDLQPNWVGMFDAAIANARSNKDNLGVEMLEFGKRLYIAQSGLSFPVGQVGQEPKK